MKAWNGSHANHRNHQDWRLGTIALPVLALVSLRYGASRDSGAAYYLERGYDQDRDDDAEHDPVDQGCSSGATMSVASKVREIIFGARRKNEHYETARALIATVENDARELNRALACIPYDPFRAIVRDLQIQREVSEYDQHQAATIYEEKIPK